MSAALDRQRFSSNSNAFAKARGANADGVSKQLPTAPKPPPQDMMIATMPYGSAEVNWIYLASISRWGTLSSNSPVAILFFDFNFDCPRGYELSEAEFELVLHPFSNEHISPQIRHCAPGNLRGKPQTEAITSRVQFVPSIEAKGVAISGMGTEKGRQWSVDHRWKLRGSRHSDPNRRTTGELTRAKWNYSSCKLSSQVDHPHTLRTGCVIDFLVPERAAGGNGTILFRLHDLTVDVNIEGKLRSMSRKLKRLMFRSRVCGVQGFPITMSADEGILKDDPELFLQQKIEQSNQKM